MLKGVLIENSLNTTDLLPTLEISKTWKDGDWILHEVSVSEKQVRELSKHLRKGPWYMHFWKEGNDEILVLFRDCVFRINQSDRSTWSGAIAHGKSIGIPEEQLDFVTS